VAAEGRSGEQDLDVGVRELRREFRGGGERREGNHDGTDAGCGQHRHDEVRSVRVQHSDVRALPRAERDQPACQLRRASMGLGVGKAVAVADQQRMLASVVHLFA
jgi:hypothetical protein